MKIYFGSAYGKFVFGVGWGLLKLRIIVTFFGIINIVDNVVGGAKEVHYCLQYYQTNPHRTPKPNFLWIKNLLVET